VKCSEGLSNRVSNVIRRCIDHVKFAACMAFLLISCSFGSMFFIHCIYCCIFVRFCLILQVMYFYIYVYTFLLLCMFCIFCFHRANWHSSATQTEVFCAFFF